jgi:hypothetical protein
VQNVVSTYGERAMVETDASNGGGVVIYFGAEAAAAVV